MKTNRYMKKILLFVSFIAAGFSASAQCTPDMSVAGDAGIHPDSAQNFAVAYVGTPYGQTVTAVVPADTCAQVLPLPLPCTTLSFDSIVVTSVTGLPPGFVFTCAVPNCAFPGNSINCAIITGTAQPGDEGVYNLTIALDAYVGGFGVPNSFTLDYYKIVVLPANSVDEVAASTFSISQNQPNPFDETTSIVLETGISGNVQLEVFNLLGQPVYNKQIAVNKGKNTITINGSAIPSGTYMYKISDGKRTLTKRMIIAH